MKAKIKEKTETRTTVCLKLKMNRNELASLYSVVHSVEARKNPEMEDHVRGKVLCAIQDFWGSED